MSETAPVSVDELGATVVRDVENRPVELRTTWTDRSALLVFIRHFG